MQSMHILVLPSWYPKYPKDSEGIFFRDQAIALKNHGHQVGVLHVVPNTSVRKLAWKIFKECTMTLECDAGIRTYRSKGVGWFPSMPKLNQMLYINRALRSIKTYIKNEGIPDIIHVQSSIKSGILAKKAKKKFGIPYVVTEHYSGFLSNDELIKNNYYKIKRALEDADNLVAVSSTLAENLQQKFPNANKAWQVIPNIANNKFFEKEISEKNDRSKFEITVIGSLNKRKGVEKVISAFHVAWQSDSQIFLNIVGSGPHKELLHNQAELLECNKNIKFFGSVHRDKVIDVLSKSDLLISASTFETFGVTLIEAMAMGKPVLTTKSGGPEDFVNISNGRLLCSTSAREFASAILEMKSIAHEFDPIKIRRDCQDRFSQHAVARALSDVFEYTLQKNINKSL